MSTPPTLLLADDSVTIQRVVALTFADQPVRLVVAKDGQDAINRMATERPDVVLADTNMPCVDGYEVAKWVRQQPHLSAVPVLLLAGATDPVDEQRLHDSGANGVLEKPFEPTHVISRVKELLGMKAAAPAAPVGRLLTPPEARPGRRPAPPAASATAVPAADAPLPVASTPLASSGAGPVEAAPDELRADAAIEDMFAAYEARVTARESASGEPATGERFARERLDSGHASPTGSARDWFPGDARTEGDAAGGPGLGFYTGPESVPRLDVPESETPRGALPPKPAAAVPGVGAPADAFETLLAAEQGDANALDAQRHAAAQAAAQWNDEMLGTLAGKVVERLQPATLRDELQGALGTSLRDALSDTVRDSVATETRAAVAEAVQAAVDGSLVGAVRGALNEAVAAAVPPAVAAAVGQGVGVRVDAAVRDSIEQTLPTAIEKAVQDFVLSRVTVLVRDTVEHELRSSIAPMVQEALREMAGASLRQVVADAVAVAMPQALVESLRGETAGQVREVVRETSERLVREEIAKIRGRQGQ